MREHRDIELVKIIKKKNLSSVRTKLSCNKMILKKLLTIKMKKIKVM